MVGTGTSATRSCSGGEELGSTPNTAWASGNSLPKKEPGGSQWLENYYEETSGCYGLNVFPKVRILESNPQCNSVERWEL